MEKRLVTAPEFCSALKARGLHLSRMLDAIDRILDCDTEEEMLQITGLLMDLLPTCKTEQELESKALQLLDSDEWKNAQ